MVEIFCEQFFKSRMNTSSHNFPLLSLWIFVCVYIPLTYIYQYDYTLITRINRILLCVNGIERKTIISHCKIDEYIIKYDNQTLLFIHNTEQYFVYKATLYKMP